MVYLLIGFLIAIGFGVGKIITSIIEEVVFERLHSNKVYRILCKKKTKSENKQGEYDKSVIGFHAN